MHNFRAYKEAFFEFGPHLNVIHGSNALGKTSLLEALHFFVSGRSFRGAQASELIRQGASHFYLEARFVKREIEQVLRATCGAGERKFVYNSTVFPSTAHLLGLLKGVVAAPDDVTLVKGPPLIRRQYLDVQIAQIDPLYVHHLTRYARALRQRNCLLRAKLVLTIESWEHEMAQSATYITRQRACAVADLCVLLKRIHQRLAESKEVLSIQYKSSADQADLEAYFLALYKKSRKREIELGATLFGPHKDDVLIMIDGKDVRSYASEGQQRTCVMGLRCAEWERLSSIGDERPLMLVDDVAIGLDDRRRALLMAYLGELSQVFLTTTSAAFANGACVQSIPLVCQSS